MRSEAVTIPLVKRMEAFEKNHIEALRNLAPECTVLLKRDGAFPLDMPCRIALYGSGARHTKRGGTGSGEVNVRSFSTIEDGLLRAGFEITTSAWLDAYDAELKKAEDCQTYALREQVKTGGIAALLSVMGETLPEPEYEIPICRTCDVAVYVLARQCGEGTDRKNMPGDFLLTETEKRDITLLCGRYRKFMLVLNVGSVVDLSPVAEHTPNILLLSQLGTVTGDCLADILLGKSYPSGKLTSTWGRIEDYPSVGTYREIHDTRYREGVFVGYRWFDAFHKIPLFPFGFGLGYTDFAVDFIRIRTSANIVSVDVAVNNIGSYRGRECVQLYIKKPRGVLSVAEKELVAYKKSNELLPGERQIITLSFHMADMSSFDESTNCFVLEKGEYIVLVGTSSRNLHSCAVLSITERTITKELSDAGGDPDFEDICSAVASEYNCQLPTLEVRWQAEDVPSFAEVFSDEIEEIVSKLSDEELTCVCVGKYSSDQQSVIGNSSFSVAGAAGETTGALSAYGVRSIVFADGPAGIRIAKTYEQNENGVRSLDNAGIERLQALLPPSMAKMFLDTTPHGGEIKHQYASAIPIATALAQSFNPTLQRQCGDIVGAEMERFGIDVWLAPAVNIQRDVLCGRNFEYYSEDPIVSGKTAAAVISGVQSHKGKGVALKHFCCNNQETNRFRSNSLVSRRALREIYLRGFEIAVRESHPACVMTSYNLLNGVHTAERVDLLQTVLRDEWGFRGVVISDWVVDGIETNTSTDAHDKQSAVRSVVAGNDLIMPGSAGDHHKILSALQSGELAREKVMISAKRIIRMIRDFCDICD